GSVPVSRGHRHGHRERKGRPRRREADRREAGAAAPPLSLTQRGADPTHGVATPEDVVKKIRLLTPGPTPVPERLSLRMAQPIVHHRSPEFEQVFARCREGLSWLFQTKQDVVQLAASGTGAMEAALVNFLRRGDEVIVIDAGKFGERWGKLAKSYGVNPVTLK